MRDPLSSSLGFVGSPLDRAGERRQDEAWLGARLADPESLFLPLWRLKPLLAEAEGRLSPVFVDRARIAARLERARPVLLGLRKGRAHYALDVSDEAEAVFAAFGRFEEIRQIAGRIAGPDGAILAAARSLIDWHARNGFCAVCGGRTEAAQGGYLRQCAACSAQHFPRTDPVAIALIHRGARCLLGRQARFPPGMFSALAGFVEPAETIEEAVRREVLEETGIRVGRVSYAMSQPWPFPSSLMIGCFGEAESEEIRVDKTELEDARWFTRAEVLRALDGGAPVSAPPPIAVAHHLIARWARGGDSD